MRKCACGRRQFLQKSVAGGNLYSCPKGHSTSTGKPRLQAHLTLGRISRWRRIKRRVRRAFDV